MVEFKKAKLDMDSHFINGNKMNARTFKGLFKRQCVMEIVVGKQFRTYVDGALDEPNRPSHVCADNPDRTGVKDSKKSFNVTEKLPGNRLSINIDAPEPGCSTSLEISQVVSINSESGEQFMGPKVVESIPSSSTKCENQGLLGTCVLCSKIKRVNRNSPKQEQCSCSDVVNEDVVCSSSTREERVSRSNKSTSEASKFLEYWVPSQISNLQLELYCSTLLSNSIPLRSCSRNDSVGALPDILLNVRKCCDHPYLVDLSLQERMLAEKRPAAEVLDVGIKASGKLQLLDVMLTESMTRGLKTLILHQSICRSGGASIGDILDDFLRQKYGPNTYERVDARVSLPKRQAAVNRFNKKETGQFAFLLENRACSSTIKLLAVDIIVLYDSDWNPANDIRALQKISIDSKAEQMKVFRLYSSCTVEERALVLAKKNLKLDNNLQTCSRTTSDSLLMWGASYLFNQLDDYHACSNNTAFVVSSGQSVLNEVTQEFQAILSESCKIIGLSVISEVQLSAENYSMNIPLLGEAQNQLKDGEEPYIFWKNLLNRKDPPWRHFRGSCSRNRKRVQYMNGSPEAENDNVAKRHKRVLHENSNPSSVQFELGEHQVTQAACSEGGGSSTIFACDKSKTFWTESVTSDSYPNCKYGQSSYGPEVDVGDPEDRGVLFDEQKNLYGFLEGEIIKLSQNLQLSEVVMDMVRRFLKYVIKNHQVSTDSPAYVQALQISLCWIAASILKQKVDKKDSLMSAKRLLDYQCTEEQVTSVYSRLRTLKMVYLQCSENFVESGNLLVEEGISMEPSNVDEEHTEGQIPIQEKMAMEDKVAESGIDSKGRNEVAPSVTSISAPSEAVCCSAPIETVPGEQIPQNLVSAELQLENQSSSQVEVSASQLVQAVDNPLLSNHGAPETDNEQLHSVSVDATLGGNQFPTFEVEHQNHARGGSSFPTAEAGEGEMLLHEPSSESRENSQLHGHLNIPSHLHAHSTHQVTTCNSTPDLSDEPLQIELERMQKESEKLEKSQKEVISKLKSECEMEIQEMIAKIRNDYDMKLKNAEADYTLKKNVSGKNQVLVLMNKMLAEAFRSKCLDHRPSDLLGMQQGDPERLRQHLQSASTLHSATPASRPSHIANLNSIVPPVQRAPALFSSTLSRPPLIGAITPSGNPHTGWENRAMAIHLQVVRPPAASSGLLILNSRPPLLLAQQMQANLVSQVRPNPQFVLPTSNVDLPVLELP
ncbi:helicase protein MOM1-like isoform X4 [Primulina huaijiensis]|uniref:helicase protein MOM1-like isoform X4 n=1 Tax=Primulina huaijiensis TaxID=1492673 RepID=UPI003CC6FF5B